MVESFEESKIIATNCWKEFPKFEMLDARIASSLNTIIQNSQFKKKVSLEEQKAQRGIVSTRNTDRLHDQHGCRLIGAHDTVLDFADLFSVTLHDDNVQEFDTIWDVILLSCPRYRPMISLKVCKK